MAVASKQSTFVCHRHGRQYGRRHILDRDGLQAPSGCDILNRDGLQAPSGCNISTSPGYMEAAPPPKPLGHDKKPEQARAELLPAARIP
eukprot:365849-Chlamydomonas_euryale.AAC.6